MRLTRFGHSCVRLENDGAVLVVDPADAPFADAAAALAGANVVLVTHQHADHLDPKAVGTAYAADSALEVYAPHDTVLMLNDAGVPAHGVGAGETVTTAGFTVHTCGGEHAVIHPDFPVPQNIGYVINSSLYHPGDSFSVPDAAVQTLLVPASGPWQKLGEAIDFIRAVAAPRAYPIHDALLSDIGLGLADRWLGLASTSTEYARLEVGISVDL